MEETKKVFYGEKEVKEVKNSDRKTYLAEPVVNIIFEDDTITEVPEEMYTALVGEKKDATAMREAIGKLIAQKLLAILLNSEVRLVDIDYILQLTAYSMNQNLDKAGIKLWKKELDERTTQDVENILK
jgi:hypothetical protein